MKNLLRGAAMKNLLGGAAMKNLLRGAAMKNLLRGDLADSARVIVVPHLVRGVWENGSCTFLLRIKCLF